MLFWGIAAALTAVAVVGSLNLQVSLIKSAVKDTNGFESSAAARRFATDESWASRLDTNFSNNPYENFSDNPYENPGTDAVVDRHYHGIQNGLDPDRGFFSGGSGGFEGSGGFGGNGF